MKSLAAFLLPLALLLSSCGTADQISLYLDFAEPNPPGSSAVTPLEITTAAGDAGRAAVQLTIQSANGFSGEVQFRAVLDGEIFSEENLATAVVYDRDDDDAATSDTPYELAAGQEISFYVIFDPEDGSGDCTNNTRVQIYTIPASDFIEVFIAACPPT